MKRIDLSTVHLPLPEADRIIKEAGYTGKYRSINLVGTPLTPQLVWKFRMVRGDEAGQDFFSVNVGIEDRQIYKRGNDVGEEWGEEEASEDLQGILN